MTHATTPPISAAQLAAFSQLPVSKPVYLHLFCEPAQLSNVERLRGQSSRCLLQSWRELTLIGSDKTWQHYALLRFDTPEPAVRALQSLNGSDGIEALVATRPERMFRVLSLLRPWLALRPRPRRKGPLPADYFQGGGNATVKQYGALRERAPGDTESFWMVNLNRLHERAQYADGDRGLSGRQAYARYARGVVMLIMRFGGRVFWFGNYHFTALGNNGDPAPKRWHEIGIVHYPDLTAFDAMLCSEPYQALYPHRHAGLEYAEVSVTRRGSR